MGHISINNLMSKQETTQLLDSHASKRNNPHAVTKAQVGLSNVDNTADSAKSVASAAKLTTARTIRTNLASTSAVSFNGTANVAPGVTGILPIANGGMGNSDGIAPKIKTKPVKDGQPDSYSTIDLAEQYNNFYRNIDLETFPLLTFEQGDTIGKGSFYQIQQIWAITLFKAFLT